MPYLTRTTLIIICFLYTSLTAQNSDNQNLSKNSLENLYKKSIQYSATNPEKAENLAWKIIKHTSKTNYKYKGLGYYSLGESYYYQDKFDDALKYYMKANPYFYLLKDSINIAGTLRNIGLIHLYKSNYNDALTAYEQSLKICTNLNDTGCIAVCYQQMGIILGDLDKLNMQQHYYTKAIKLYNLLNDKKSTADINLNMGYSFIRQGDYKKGSACYNEALKVYKNLKDSSRVASVYNNLGCLYMRTKEFKKATNYYIQSEQIFTALNDKFGLIHTYMGLGDLYTSYNDKEKAITYYNKSEQINKTIGLTNERMSNFQKLYYAYKDMEEYKQAISVLEDYYELKDSVYYASQNDKVLEMENKYKFQKNKNELAEATAKNRFYLLITIIAISLVIIILSVGWFYLRNKGLQGKQRLLSLEQKVLRTQMNPHFIFNSLSAIQCYILENKTIDAVDFLAEFAGLMRMVLQYSQEEYISLDQEREILDYYIQLQNRRFGDKIRYEIIIDKKLNASRVQVPPMLGQPFIENSFEHGDLINKPDGKITVRFQQKDNKLLYIIEDNGVGIENSPEQNQYTNMKKHKSLAIKITKERLSLINKGYLQNKVALVVEDKAQHGEEGTRVSFTLPIIEVS